MQAIALGILCNALVCLAVWLTYGAHTTTDKILAIIPPIAAFVAAGFEHSVANMYFISIGLLVKSDDEYVASLDPETAPDLSELTWGSFFVDNLLPVTIGTSSGSADGRGRVLARLSPPEARRAVTPARRGLAARGSSFGTKSALGRAKPATLEAWVASSSSRS